MPLPESFYDIQALASCRAQSHRNSINDFPKTVPLPPNLSDTQALASRRAQSHRTSSTKVQKTVPLPESLSDTQALASRRTLSHRTSSTKVQKTVPSTQEPLRHPSAGKPPCSEPPDLQYQSPKDGASTREPLRHPGAGKLPRSETRDLQYQSPKEDASTGTGKLPRSEPPNLQYRCPEKGASTRERLQHPGSGNQNHQRNPATKKEAKTVGATRLMSLAAKMEKGYVAQNQSLRCTEYGKPGHRGICKNDEIKETEAVGEKSWVDKKEWMNLLNTKNRGDEGKNQREEQALSSLQRKAHLQQEAKIWANGVAEPETRGMLSLQGTLPKSQGQGGP